MGFFSHNFPHAIYVAVPSGATDANGTRTLGASVKRSARVQGRRELVRDSNTTETMSTHVIYTDTEIPAGASIWIPHLGDTRDNLTDARHILSSGDSERLRGGDPLYKAWL